MFCGGYGAYGFGSLGSGFALLSMGFSFLLFVGLIILAYKLFKQFSSNSNGVLKVLDLAYVKGEISEEEYIKKKAILIRKS